MRAGSKVLYAPNSQPFLIAGSGTLGWDAVGANLIEQGDNAVSHSPAQPPGSFITARLEHGLLW